MLSWEGLKAAVRRSVAKKSTHKKTSESREVIDPTTGEITVVENQEEDDEEEQEIEDDRGRSSVNRSLPLQSKILTYVLMGGVIVVTVFVLGRYYVQLFRKQHEQKEETTVTVKNAPTQNVTPPFPKGADSSYGLDAPAVPPPGATAADKPAAAAGAGDAKQDPNAGGKPQREYDQQGRPILTPEELIEQRKKTGSVTVKFDGQGGGTAAVPVVAQGGTSNSSVGTKTEGWSEDLKPSYLPGVKAQVIPDRNMFITRGKNLDCLIDEAIDTAVPGMLTCRLTRDVYGQSGLVVLLEKGTLLTGNYKADLKGKDSRLYCLWERLETPSGVVVELASPSGDGLGRAGISLVVDTHFMERFSAGMLISVVGDGAAVLANRSSNVQGNNNSVAFPNTTQNATTMATEAIKQNSGIPNTGKQNQAVHINVYVARDIDFRGVYKLEPTQRRR